MTDYCLFCDRDNKEQHTIICENDLFYSRRDNIPITNGHSEIVPKDHLISFFDLDDLMIRQLFDLLNKTKGIIDKEFNPDSYNIGVNDGQAAGRTINHLHIHLIPRYHGDVENPRGGVRNIIPGKGDYKDPSPSR